jgi:uncharacterized protein (TIRG00374 family)
VAAWLSVRQVRWPALLEVLQGARLAPLGWALALILATTAAKAARWAILLRPVQHRTAPGRLCRVLLIGQMANSFLPRLGDVVRAVLLGPDAREGAPAVLGTILVEKALDGVLGLALLVGLGLWTPLPSWMRGPLLGLAVLTGTLLLLLSIASLSLTSSGRMGPSRWAQSCGRAWRALAGWLPRDLGGRFEPLVGAFARGLGLLRSPGDAALALGLSVVVWALSILTNVVTLQALEIDVPAWVAGLVVVTGYAATFLPTVPAQLGVFEYAAVLSLSAASVAPEPALAFALILHLLVQLPPATLGPLSMVVEGLGWSRLAATRQEPLEPDDERC